MKKYIERYIYAVTKRLPSSMRPEVAEELEANIRDMIGSENPSDDLILTTLKKLGHPRQLANQYRGKERYVVSPEYYDDYVGTLKVVGSIFIIVSLVTGIIDALTSMTSIEIVSVFQNVFENIFDHLWEGLLMTFAWTTIGFWIASSVNHKKSSDDWKLSDLPDLPEPHQIRISRVGVMVELVFGISFSLIFIIVLQNGIPYVIKDVVQPFIPFFYIGIILELCVGIIKIIYGTWTIPVIVMTILNQIYSAILAYFFLTSGFLDPGIYEAIAANSEFTIAEAQNGISIAKNALIWIIILGSIAETISILNRYFRAKFSGK